MNSFNSVLKFIYYSVLLLTPMAVVQIAQSGHGSAHSLAGKVNCESDKADLVGLFVIVEDEGDASKKYVAKTSSDGTFSIADVPAGKYSVSILQAEGILTELSDWSFTGSENLALRIGGAKFSVRVVDSTGMVVEGAHVRVRNTSGKFYSLRSTDANGKVDLAYCPRELLTVDVTVDRKLGSTYGSWQADLSKLRIGDDHQQTFRLDSAVQTSTRPASRPASVTGTQTNGIQLMAGRKPS